MKIEQWVEPIDMPGDIRAFHEKFGLSPMTHGHDLPTDLLDFRLDFMREELDEYIVALSEGDHNKAFDALIDLVYVAMGTAYLHGYPWAEGWRRVQEANVAKVRVEHAEDSKRGSTYDVVKPEGWQAPDHANILYPNQIPTFDKALEK